MKTKIVTSLMAGTPYVLEAAELIRKGELVAFPTETVYGLGANGLDPEAVKKIFKVKGRPQDNPLILHIGDLDQLDELIDEELDDWTRDLLTRIWPGPITFIFKKSKLVPDIVTAGGDTVAIRMPSNEVALDLLQHTGVPVAAPSANLSGRPSPTNAYDVMEDMDGKIAMIIDGGFCPLGVESTVVDLTELPPVILRPGFYSQYTLKNLWPNIISPEDLGGDEKINSTPDSYIPPMDYDPNEWKRDKAYLDMDPDKREKNPLIKGEAISEEQGQKDPVTLEELFLSLFSKKTDDIPRAPGMKYRHYAPKAKLTVYLGEREAVARRMVTDARPLISQGLKPGFMVFQNMTDIIEDGLGQVPIADLGDGHLLVTMAQNLFLNMRGLDRENCDVIFSVGVEPRHLGAAIMNRLRKASGGNIIVVK